MRYVDEFRNEEQARALVRKIRERTNRPMTIMEICGGQTHTIVKYGIDQVLPEQVSLVHGPGCPVCVTPLSLIDQALAIARRPEVVLTSFGDMLRVPGSSEDLLAAKAAGADVRMVYSPLDALQLAQKHPDKEVVFFGVGFETTAPANAMAVKHAATLGVENFSLLSAHVLVPPAMRAILSSPQNRVQGFLAAGHVCSVMGFWEYEPIADEFEVPIVVTGFEPVDILQGIYRTVAALAAKQSGVSNQYSRSVRRDGNLPAQALLEEVFEVCDRAWRGIGTIPKSGFKLREHLQRFDAAERFAVGELDVEEPSECIAGLILQGLKKPHDCPAFAGRCTPEHPKGAPMVSSEGACAAYYHYGRR